MYYPTQAASAGVVYYENAKRKLVGHSFDKNSVRTMLALAQYITDKGGDAKFDRKEFDDKYYDQIDEETIDIFIKEKNENRLETDLMDPNDLLNDYDQTMDNTYRIYTDDLKTNLTPRSITKFQDDIKEIIYGRPPQNEKEFEEFKAKLIDEINALQIEGMPKVEKLNALVGQYVNLPYRLPSGMEVKFLNDKTTYLGNQLESEFGGDGCFGVLASMDFIMVATYEKDGTNPELVLYKKR